jgi:hypothetical protein
MQFSELKLGDVFKFKWEQDREWVYEKVESDRIKCIQTPKTYSHLVGEIHSWCDKEQEVVPYQNTVFVVSCFERTGAAVSHDQLAEIVIFSTKEKALEFAQTDTKYDYTEINELLVR